MTTEDLNDFTTYYALDSVPYTAPLITGREPEEKSRWWEDANCHGMSEDVFYPVAGDSATTATVKRICGDCPVKRECKRDVMLFEAGVHRDYRHGHWAGMSPAKRWALERRWRAAFGRVSQPSEPYTLE